jgi:ribosomal protein L7/L12
MSELTPDQVQKIHKLLHDKQVIQAIQVYREATGVSLVNAKKAIEEMALVEVTKPPSGMRSYDDPVLESKIKSLLAKGQKINALKIYREEYGIGLNEAKVAVDRIEASMPRDSATGTPYESAIGRGPFAEEDGTNRGRIAILAVALIIALCGVGGFILILLSNP